MKIHHAENTGNTLQISHSFQVSFYPGRNSDTEQTRKTFGLLIGAAGRPSIWVSCSLASGLTLTWCSELEDEAQTGIGMSFFFSFSIAS